MKINPFQPNYPISPGMFVGRIPELERLETHLIQTRAGNPSNFLLTGERGIGKSSLLNYIKYVAQGDISVENETLNFLVIDTDIDQNTTQIGLIKKIELGLRRELGKTEPAREFLKNIWSFLKDVEIEAAGFKLGAEAKAEQEETVLEEFSYSLADTVNRLCSNSDDQSTFNAKYDGVLLLIDEADNGSKFLNLGSFFKLLTERLQRRTCNHFMVGLAGLPNVREVLLSSHPSSLRLFEEISLSRLDDEEVKSVTNICLEKASKDNKSQYSIEVEGQKTLISLSEGYPHFIQQCGFCAFRADIDNILDHHDIVDGAFCSGGALELIGDRYYRDNFYNKIQQESYRQVLRIMADDLDSWVSKQDIKKKFKGNDTTLDNAIKALRARHIILSKEGERGVYRLQHKGFALWIKLKATNSADLMKSLFADEAD